VRSDFSEQRMHFGLAGHTDLDDLDKWMCAGRESARDNVGVRFRPKLALRRTRKALAFQPKERLSDDLDAVDLKQRHCGVAADLGVVVHLPQHGHRGPENIVLN
jgi:hypothetical protein